MPVGGKLDLGKTFLYIDFVQENKNIENACIFALFVQCFKSRKTGEFFFATRVPFKLTKTCLIYTK